MMNQGQSAQSSASLEKHQINDLHQIHASSYFSSNGAVGSWSTQGENHSLGENGVVSNSGYNHDQVVEPTARNVQDGTNVAPTVPTPSSAPANVAQGYSGYAAYPNGYNHDQVVEPTARNVQDGTNVATTGSTPSPAPANVAQGYSNYAAYPNGDPYGYNSTTYAAYYNQYQQQSNQYQQQPSQYPQQPNQYPQQPSQYPQQPSQYPQQQSQYPQQPSQYQPQTSQYQPQTSQYPQQPSQYPQQPSQYQQQANQYQQPPNQSYTHHVGAYQNTGAPYQPLSSFQNTGSYPGTASYSSTYYNPGDYQTSGSYTSDAYGTQTNPWNGGQYGTYTSQQYPNYNQDTNSANSTTSAVATSQYQQQYKQWQDYYNQNQTEVTCAPGTENIPVSISSSVNSSVPSGSIGYTGANNQIPAAYTHVWRPESSSSELTSVQPVAVSDTTADDYWKHGASAFQNETPNYIHSYAQKPAETTPACESFQNQPNPTFSQVSTAQYPTSYQVSQSHQTSFQTIPQPPELLYPQKASNLQIPTNPRIAPNVSMSLSKTTKDNSMASTAARPAYISVPVQKPNEKEEAESMLKPGVFPKSLRGYVERALSRCKNDRQKAACQTIMKEVITKATADGTLYTKDWDIEPLFPMPNTDAVDKDNIQFPVPTSVTPKTNSPSRRAKSRWEPIPEEKVVDKPANVSYGNIKYGNWNAKQFSGGKIENKANSTRFSFSDQKSFSKTFARPTKRQRLGEDLNAADDGETSSDSDKEQSLTKYYSAAVALADTPEEKKKRENRSKRFDKGNGNRAQKGNSRAKTHGAGNLYARRASALVLSRTFEESGSRAVEDIDWDALTVKGTCQEIEKRYLRLTSAPDPATVRPEEVLEKALLMVQNSPKNYLYKCDQLKSIRQDLTVQRICNELTVKVYETHARLAIEVGDMPEINQCQSQLKTLYAEGIPGCHMEFAAYNLLSVILHSNNNRDLVSAMSRLSASAKNDKAVKHALSVRRAVTSGNYVLFFRLYKTAPNLNTFLMDLYVEKMRYAAVKCISRSCRPTAPVLYLAQILGFSSAISSNEVNDDKEVDGVEECIEWLKAHGATLISDSSGETLLDGKASAPNLYMPEPEDAVSHGDASLAVNDFLTRSLS